MQYNCLRLLTSSETGIRFPPRKNLDMLTDRSPNPKVTFTLACLALGMSLFNGFGPARPVESVTFKDTYNHKNVELTGQMVSDLIVMQRTAGLDKQMITDLYNLSYKPLAADYEKDQDTRRSPQKTPGLEKLREAGFAEIKDGLWIPTKKGLRALGKSE
jgi:hypothetical protein